MGEQIEEQYPRAVGSMREVLKFGAMMLHVREVVLPECSHRENIAQKGHTSKGQGLLGWVTKYAPSINYKTACRFMDVADAIRKEFTLPANAAKQLTFADLATIPTDQLDAQFRALQEKLFAFVEGTSQKSWLDQFKESSERGGDTSGRRKKLTPAEEHELFLKTAREDFAGTFMGLDKLVLSGNWKAPSIKDAELEEAMELAAKFAKEARQWLNTPKKERKS